VAAGDVAPARVAGAKVGRVAAVPPLRRLRALADLV
jgi:hypothetical protein